jgi:hypothetical protein
MVFGGVNVIFGVNLHHLFILSHYVSRPGRRLERIMEVLQDTTC